MFKQLSIKSKELALIPTGIPLLNEDSEKKTSFLAITRDLPFGISEFIKRSQEFYQLTSLEISDVKIIFHQVEILGLALQSMTRLLCLVLTKTELCDIGVKKIMDVLPTSLVTLDLPSNHIENGICFSTDQKIWKYLRNFNLSGNEIKQLGLIDFIETLKHHQAIPLRGLYLKETKMGDPEIKVLSQEFTLLTSLNNLDLSYNKIGDQGAMSLCETLSLLTHLRRFELRRNPISDQCLLHLVNEASKIKNLKIPMSRKKKINPVNPYFF